MELFSHILCQSVQAKAKTSKRRKIMKIRTEINEKETKKKMQRINETKSWFFEKLKKIDKPLVI
jgi:hypothetical protein